MFSEYARIAVFTFSINFWLKDELQTMCQQYQTLGIYFGNLISLLWNYRIRIDFRRASGCNQSNFTIAVCLLYWRWNRFVTNNAHFITNFRYRVYFDWPMWLILIWSVTLIHLMQSCRIIAIIDIRWWWLWGKLIFFRGQNR